MYIGAPKFDDRSEFQRINPEKKEKKIVWKRIMTEKKKGRLVPNFFFFLSDVDVGSNDAVKRYFLL